MQTIGERIKLIRSKLGMTQVAFSERIGLKRNSIALVESGDRGTSEPVIRAICREFGVSYDWLMNERGDGPFVSSQEVDVAALTNIMIGDDEFAKNLFRAFARFGPEDWKRLRQFMEGVLRSTEADEQKK